MNGSNLLKENNSKKLFIKVLIIVLSIIILSPILIALIVTNGFSIFAKSDGDSSVWIGFWGSYLGGALGTIGVIFVAQLQNNKQIESMHTIENNERNRLKNSTLINMLSEYRELLDELNIRLNTIQTDLTSIYIRKREMAESSTSFSIERVKEIHSLNQKVLNNDLNLEGPIRRIIANNDLFLKVDLDMKEGLPSSKKELVKNLFEIIEYIVDDTKVLKTKEEFKDNLETIEFYIGDLIKDPLYDSSAPVKRGIYMKPFDEFINWLDKEIENVDKNIILLINELSTQEK